MSNSKSYFKADNINDLYIDVVNEVVNNPQYVSAPRGMKIKEIINVNAILTNPLNNIVTLNARKMNHAFSIVEKFEYLSGQGNPNRLAFYNKNLSPFFNKYGMQDGAYPERLHYWLRYIYNLLKIDPDSRQGVATIYGPQDRHETKDIPCTCIQHYMIRENKLNLTVYMRSNDLLWGFPYDVSAFCFLQQAMAAMLNINVGVYTHIVGSMHSYNEKEKELTTILKDSSRKNIKNRKLPHYTFDEMMQNINLFWYIENQYRNNFDNANQMNQMKTVINNLPISFIEYLKILYTYIKKQYER